MTTQLLARAFAEAAKLPAREQDALATFVLEEMATEKQWDAAFANSQDMLAQMAEAALAEHQQGVTRPLVVDAL